MTAMPDLRKRYKSGIRKNELTEVRVAAATAAVELGLEISQRPMIDRFC